MIRGLWRCQLMSWFTIVGWLTGSLTMLAVLALPVGVGFLAVTPAAVLLRRVSDVARGWAGVTDRPGPLPSRAVAILGTEAFWRDLTWAMVDPLTGGLLLAVPIAFFWYGIFGVLVQPFLWRSLGPGNWYAFIPVDSVATMLAALMLGAGFVAIALTSATVVLDRHARWTRRMLAEPRNAALARRIAQLADTRAEALDAQATELHRIERDLHDGAQARIVAMGMTLDQVARLLDTDLPQARRLLVEARTTSDRALTELRDLVRGINPPVLADRGLGDAVRALALDSFLDVEVAAELPGRLPAPVESAAYFAVAELLANAGKHARARTVRISITHDGDALHLTVTDDGAGGADPANGTGLRGVRRRLDRFDGTLAIASPPGGPTQVTMEIPCASSSPKTSSSSVTD
ncbi:histidine kinase [Actinoplanes sp. SE50]|nr:Phytochrome 1 [Actinoplanes sp. SE50/110]ATO82854.1 histidine kinase [Actinoplanes sp. SE50]SLM00262.1 signal transduction histidine kinase [Actinoplanes sp. SE50/110]